MDKTIKNIRDLAHRIDVRINLFEGYEPKKTTGYKQELLFWRKVTNLYGLFVDCDRVQIKEKENLIGLMYKYSLIENGENESAKQFWKDVSDLRKWFCHNNNGELYYSKTKEKSIRKYLNKVFLCSSDKPEGLEQMQTKGWDLLNADLDRRFSEYLGTLENGLKAWQNYAEKEKMIGDWNRLFAKALFADKELIRNVLSDIAEYKKINTNNKMSVSALTNWHERNLNQKGYSEANILKVLIDIKNKKSNKEIIYESICQIDDSM